MPDFSTFVCPITHKGFLDYLRSKANKASLRNKPISPEVWRKNFEEAALRYVLRFLSQAASGQDVWGGQDDQIQYEARDDWFWKALHLPEQSEVY